MNKAEILEGLNENQKNIVLNYAGKNMCLATAGSGKTRVVVMRAAYMIEDGVDPKNMLLFTFTKKAANEMKERVEKIIGSKAAGITISTYHSFCCTKILRNYIEKFGNEYTRQFTIYDEADSKSTLKRILSQDKYKKLNAEIPQVKHAIAMWRKNMVSPAEAAQFATGNDRMLADAYAEYCYRLQKNNAVDFDSMIYLAIRLLENYPEVREAINKKYRWISLDEGQDSVPQNDLRLVTLLGGPDPKNWNVNVVGDIRQSKL